MRRWKPQPGPGLWIGLFLLGLSLVGAVYVGVQFTLKLLRPPEEWPVNLALYGELITLVALLLISGLLAYRVASRLTLAYEMDRNGLYILWLGNRVVVPLAQVETVDSGAAVAYPPWVLLQGIGYYRSEGQISTSKRLHVFATRSPRSCLLIHTASDAYAISPVDPDSFVQDLEQRRRLGAVKTMNAAIERGGVFSYAFWGDRVIRWALFLAFALNLILLGFLAARYPALSATVEMGFNAAGQTVDLRPRHQVLFLPLAALMLCLLNMGLGLMLYQQEQTGARLLQFGSVLVQVLFAVAAFAIVIM